MTGPLPSLLYVTSYGWSTLTYVDLILVILVHCSGDSQVGCSSVSWVCMLGGCGVTQVCMLVVCGVNHVHAGVMWC